jgi:photosystem II stability/assembly factor-like uncharacterized protein
LDDKTAVIASAGVPAVLLRTIDQGDQWTEVYRHPSPQAFFDGFSFWDSQHGLAVSDPVDGYWVILGTSDGGQSWTEWKRESVPVASPGEAAFAASSGCLLARSDREIWLGIGGASHDEPMARIYRRADSPQLWIPRESTLLRTASSGVFAIDFRDSQQGLAVGGDYRRPDQASQTAAWTEDGGQSWHAAQAMPSGFRSSVAFCTRPTGSKWMAIAVGPNGTDATSDGKQWRRVSDTGFHVLRSDGTGTVWAAGSEGRIGRFPYRN